MFNRTYAIVRHLRIFVPNFYISDDLDNETFWVSFLVCLISF